MPRNIELKSISSDETNEDIPEVLPVTEEEIRRAKKEGKYIDTSEKAGEWVKNEEGASEFKKKENLENAITEEENNPDKIKNEKGKLDKVFKEESQEEKREEQEAVLEVLEKKLKAMEDERYSTLLGYAKKFTLNPITMFKKGIGSIATFTAKFNGADPYECSRIMASFIIPKDERGEFLELNSKTGELDKKVKALKENLGKSEGSREKSSEEE